MPEIARFLGIIVAMYWNDHSPPHIHVFYTRHYRASINIRTGEIIDGELPKPQLKKIKNWCSVHEDALMKNWERARNRLPLEKIKDV